MDWLARQLRLASISVLPGVALLVGCAGTALGPVSGPPRAINYFAQPSPQDPWSPKIAGWQSREQAQPAVDDLQAPAEVSNSGLLRPVAGTRGDLRKAYFQFRKQEKREIAAQMARWIQRQARSHYVPDGPIDHWATLEETLARNGDDCDGLELLAYHFLRDLGFGKDEVFRAVVRRPKDGQHHMVTLWFDTPDDPYVIDPTGAMTTGMPRMSEVKGWETLKIFNADEEFSPRPIASR